MPPDCDDSATELWGEPAAENAASPEQWAFDPGAIVADRFRIVSLLGRGGMGEVFRAEDLRLGQTVALKFLPPALAANEAAMQSLASEVRIGRQISHPNVCRLYDLIEHGGYRFLAMEFVDGEDLASLLRRIGRPSTDKAMAMCAEIAVGLGAAHGQRVTHRDLKPANIMIDREGVAKVADFGLAIEADRQHGIAGTPAYMAPEQLAGGPVGPKADLYALGLVMWEVFTGQRLFDGATLDDIRRQHKAPKGRPSAFVGPLDPTVETILVRCLEEDPKRRPASVREVIESFPDAPSRSSLTSTTRTKGSSDRTASSPEQVSIAVLPFEDFGGAEDDWFTVGLADEIIADLAKIRTLRVISRGSVMRFKGVQECRPVAMELGVQFVLTGAVRRAGKRLRITTSLIDGADESLVWSEKFQGTDDDVFDIQEEIARAIAAELEIELSTEEAEEIAERRMEDPVALECYVRARDLVWTYTEAGLNAALRLLEKGLDRDPGNVVLLATAGTAWWQFFNSGFAPTEETLHRAESFTERIFELEPDSHHAYRVLGLVALSRGDVTSSVLHLKRVVDQQPRDGDALAWLSCILSLAGLTEVARPLGKRAIEVDPLGTMSQVAPIFADWYQGRFDRAVDTARHAGICEPDNPGLSFVLWCLLRLARRDDEARLLVELVPRMEDGTFTRLMKFQDAAYEGDRAEMDALADLLEAPARLDLQYSSVMAESWALVGEIELALDWLNNAVDRGFLAWEYLARFSRSLESLREEPGFRQLVERARREQADLRELLAERATRSQLAP